MGIWRIRYVTVLALAAACGVAGCRGEQDAKGQPPAASRSQTGVVVQVVQSGPIFETLTLPGTVEAIQDTTLSAEVSGRLVNRPVTEGQRVEAKQLLAEIDAATAKATWEQAVKSVTAARRAKDAAAAAEEVANSGVQTAEAAVKEVQAAEARARQRKESIEKLFKTGDATQDEYDEVLSQATIAAARVASAQAGVTSANAQVVSASAAVKQAEAAVDVALSNEQLAKIALDKHTIHSPVAGIVDELPYDPEEYVQAGTPICRIVRTDRVKVLVNVPERDVRFIKAMKEKYDRALAADPRTASRPVEPEPGANEIREDQPLVRFKLAMPGYQRYGVIDWVAMVADPATRTYETRILLDNLSGDAANPLVRPGMIATVQMVRQVNRKAVSVPINAVVTRGGRPVIYVFHPGEDDPNVGTAVEESATFGLADPTRVEIIGLPAGAKVIVEWDIELSPGDAVRVKQWRKEE